MAAKRSSRRSSRNGRSSRPASHRHGNVVVSESFLREMREILSKHHYDPREATRLAEEGMGPHELEHRIRTTTPGGMGSLEYTHGIHKAKRRAKPRPWCKGVGMRGLTLRSHKRYDRCPICEAIFVKHGTARLPVHREGTGDVSHESLGL